MSRTWLFVSSFAFLAACHDRNAAPPPAKADPPARASASLSASASASASPSAVAPSPSSATAQSFYADRFSKKPKPQAMMELGRSLFFDQSLSVSGKMACASCHDPRFAYGPPNEQPTQLGGPDLKLAGLRAVPSLRYLQTVPAFTQHFYEEGGPEADQGPTGGHTWDGRADSLHDQTRIPLLSPLEMANPSIDAVVQKVVQGPSAAQFKDVFGADVFSDPTRASTAVLMVLEVFQQSPKDFYPYTSRYDAYLRRQTTLSAREERGLELFNDPRKGNCSSCHPSVGRDGAFPAFSDFGFAALGVPRNATLPANKDAKFFDLGLCGPLRTDLSSQRQYCGMFRVPPLRNVAIRRVFFHNGVVHNLEAAVRFYVERGQKFDDLPADVQKNVNREAPFDRKPGQPPALSKSEIADLIVFLNTLTDQDMIATAAKP